jgi:hypothetical protein
MIGSIPIKHEETWCFLNFKISDESLLYLYPSINETWSNSLVTW